MVPEIKKILCPTDMSDTSNYAFNYAASLANRYDASITVLHVLENPMPTSENLVTNVLGTKRWQKILDQNKTEVIEKIRLRLENYCEMTKAELSSCPFLLDEVIVKIGSPVQEILLEIDSNNYDLVILSAHGQGVLADTLMGSVSRRVLRRSKASVLVVRLPEKE